jgi:hypothetical protein
MRRRATGAVVALTVVLVAVVGSPAAAQDDDGDEIPAPGRALAEVCLEGPVVEVPEAGPRACKNIDSGAVLLALLCAETPMSPAQCSALTDGRDVDPASIDEFEAGWVHRALRLQSRLDLAEPWLRTLVPHTHNAGNSTAYDPSVSTADPNQRFSITDQLRMGSRGIELDLHWTFHPTGTPETTGRAVVDCHGRSEGVGPLRVHVGCSVDRLAEQNLAEVGDFLRAPGNEREVVLLYLENQLDGDPRAHDLAVEAIERQLGDLVARPAGDGCTPMPMDESRADVLAAGHQVLIVGNCGPGAWTSWVHERGPRWSEGSNTAGYPDAPACEALRPETARDYEGRFIRTWEDQTWLSAMVGTPSDITPAEARAMVRCGVNMIGFDRLLPDDGRLEALVWSWAPHEPTPDGGRCAAWGDDARFRAAACHEPRPFTCRDGDGGWLVTTEAGPWSAGFATCEALGATFAVPPTGWDNEVLRRSAGDADPAGVWLNLADTDADGWIPALTAAPPELVDPGDPTDPVGPGPPGGGRPPWAPGPPPERPGPPPGAGAGGPVGTADPPETVPFERASAGRSVGLPAAIGLAAALLILGVLTTRRRPDPT